MVLVPLAQAQRILLDSATPLEPARIALREAFGHVLAAPAISAEDVPPFDNSAMDGYALRAADASTPPSTLQVIATIAAGRPGNVVVGPGQAARIMTGAPIPAGADSIVMVEQTEAADDGATVRVLTSVGDADHVRRAGSDVQVGIAILDVGVVLGPSQLGLLASVGEDRPLVHPRPVVGVLATGDELAEPGTPMRHGQIRDSNRAALLACLERDRFVAVDLGIVVDDYAAVRERIEAALSECDALLTSGGVSVGDFDHVKRVVSELATAHGRGAMAASIGVAIRPAKPFAYAFLNGRSHDTAPVLGLPGNPVSSLVSYELLARPVLRRMAGHTDPVRWETVGRAGEDFSRTPDGKTHFVRVAAEPSGDGVLEARSSGGQGSHQLSAMASANAFAVLPDGEGVRKGETLGLLVLDPP
jgi:molybdenum cofactor synthesis domain-containing protein